ncbi:MAG: uroporphyrinogen-III C-methyltransferase [Candidatus Omnitrophica bacterium]|nr:uroporphyrinogen-III C-methyltransferase [Candidatus Omnitrophota bacterium]
MKKGTVYFVGAGPWDPGLITRKGAWLLSRAGCVVYDRLVNPELLKLAPSRCEKIYAGKGPDQRGGAQSAINRLLLKKSRRYETVVRLKGGDPTLFGRIGEEIEALDQEKIPFEVVPGVSSAWAAAAAVGIPLTDRRVSSSVAIVTGREASGKRPSVRWEALARGADTLVILMGRSSLLKTGKRLLKAGRSEKTPVALVRWAWSPQQELLVTSLGRLEETLKARTDFGPPVVVIVGQGVRFALKGKKVLVTRPSSDSEELSGKLEALGATCVELPTIEIRPREISRKEAEAIITQLPRCHWVIFTSHHGVESLERVVRRSGKKLSRLIRGRICAIGPRTARAAREAGLPVALLPEEFSTAGLREAFRKIPVKGRRVLIPRSNLGARDGLSRMLKARGAGVEEPVMYETVLPEIPPRRVKQALQGLDCATFTSASTVRGFLKAARGAKVPLRKAVNGAKVVAIGPATAEALQEGGITDFYLPRDSWTVDSLVSTVAEVLR